MRTPPPTGFLAPECVIAPYGRVRLQERRLVPDHPVSRRRVHAHRFVGLHEQSNRGSARRRRSPGSVARRRGAHHDGRGGNPPPPRTVRRPLAPNTRRRSPGGGGKFGVCSGLSPSTALQGEGGEPSAEDDQRPADARRKRDQQDTRADDTGRERMTRRPTKDRIGGSASGRGCSPLMHVLIVDGNEGANHGPRGAFLRRRPRHHT